MRGSHILGRIAMVAIPAAGIALAPVVASASGPFIGGLTHVTTLGSTVPHNGDVNPYGMAVVTENWGRPRRRRRARQQLQCRVERPGHRHDDRADDAPRRTLGLRAHHRSTTCAASAPAASGSPPRSRSCSTSGSSSDRCRPPTACRPTAKAGCLIILNSNGHVVETLNNADGINGPWDLTVGRSRR